jgi:hypothetical protein
MPARRIDPRVVKLHRTYDVAELAARLGVHKNTVRHWQGEGLKPIDRCRPTLFYGSTVRTFLLNRRTSRKSPCSPGTLYCFRCRAPRRPALGMVDYIPINASGGNVRAVCAVCETVMHRRAAKASLATILPDCEVLTSQAPKQLKGSPSPSLNCDLERQATT